MIRILAVLVMLPGAAFAQSFSEAFPDGVPENALNGVDPSIFIGAPLLSNDEKYELTKAPEFQFSPTDYLVIGEDAVKPAESWNATDTSACEASGGIVLPLPAGRTMCFRF